VASLAHCNAQQVPVLLLFAAAVWQLHGCMEGEHLFTRHDGAEVVVLRKSSQPGKKSSVRSAQQPKEMQP
jgi:hypothetical protein